MSSFTEKSKDSRSFEKGTKEIRQEERVGLMGALRSVKKRPFELIEESTFTGKLKKVSKKVGKGIQKAGHRFVEEAKKDVERRKKEERRLMRAYNDAYDEEKFKQTREKAKRRAKARYGRTKKSKYSLF
jgi:hypothetical protein